MEFEFRWRKDDEYKEVEQIETECHLDIRDREQGVKEEFMIES